MTDMPLLRHADHDPAIICRPAFGNGLCEPLIMPEDVVTDCAGSIQIPPIGTQNGE